MRSEVREASLKKDLSVDDNPEASAVPDEESLSDNGSNFGIRNKNEIIDYRVDEDHFNSTSFYSDDSHMIEAPVDHLDPNNWSPADGNIDDRINFSSILGMFFKTEKKKTFEPQLLIEKIRQEEKYSRNTTWQTQYQLLRCQSQPFLTRITLNGEFYDVPSS